MQSEVITGILAVGRTQVIEVVYLLLRIAHTHVGAVLYGQIQFGGQLVGINRGSAVAAGQTRQISLALGGNAGKIGRDIALLIPGVHQLKVVLKRILIRAVLYLTVDVEEAVAGDVIRSQETALDAVLNQCKRSHAFLGIQYVLEVLFIICDSAQRIQLDSHPNQSLRTWKRSHEPSTSEVTFL